MSHGSPANGSGSRDELGAVDHRAAADGKQEIDLLAAREFDRLHQGFVGRVGFDAAKFEQRVAFERGFHFVQCAGLDDAAAAIGDQYAGARGNLACDIGDTALAEEDAGRIMESEVLHEIVLLVRFGATRNGCSV